MKKEKTREAPRIRIVMLPKDTNGLGNIFGGVILSHIDLAAGEHARSIAPLRYVTKVMKEVEFIAPVKVGDTVSFYTETMQVGTTSVRVKVLCTSTRGIGKIEEIKVTEAEVVMVAVNENGDPIPIA
jgi:acyl-CoA thioesterase YciA